MRKIPLLLALAASPLMAHDFWIEPSTFRPAVGELITANLRVGQDFVGDPVPRESSNIERFVVRDSGGERPVVGRDGRDPDGYTNVLSPGAAVIGYRSLPKPLELPPEKFEDYLRQEGLERIIAWRAQHGQSKQPSKEIFSRCAKAIVAAGPPESRRVRAIEEPLGFRLELVPESDPFAAGALRVRVTFENKPLEGALVIALNQQDPAAKVSLRSDKAGRVSLPLSKGGVWLIKCVHMVPAPPASGAQWESLWASLTFER